MMARRAPKQPNPLMRGNDIYWASASYNQRLFIMFRQQIIDLALTRFRWVNLPPTCDSRYLEWTLLFQGCATIAHPKSDPNRWYSTQVAYDSPLNVYDNPTRWKSIGNNGWRFGANIHSGAIVWDNMLRMPINDWIDIYARELVDVMRTKQMNRMHQKIPYILKGDQSKAFDMTNLYKQIAGGEPAVLTTNGIDAISVDVLKTDVPYLGAELQTEWENIWNAIYTMLGIDNLPFKSERQIEAEVKSMTMPTTLMALNPLQSRRQALRKLRHIAPDVFNETQVVWNDDNESENYRFEHNVMAQIEHLDGKGGDDESDTDIMA